MRKRLQPSAPTPDALQHARGTTREVHQTVYARFGEKCSEKARPCSKYRVCIKREYFDATPSNTDWAKLLRANISTCSQDCGLRDLSARQANPGQGLT